MLSFSKSSEFRQNVIRSHENEKPAFTNFFGLKSVLKNSVFVRRISVDSRPRPRNKAAFSNSSNAVWKLPYVFDVVSALQSIVPIYLIFWAD